MKYVFARYNIPNVLVTDDGTQFASTEFAVFAETWSFKHHTSSPCYPQSNGRAENAVQMLKRLFTKCKASGQSKYLALFDWQNTPMKGVETSRAQRLFGCRCKTVPIVWYTAPTSTLKQRRNESYNGREASVIAFL